jgi:hypothetical protein
MTNYLAEPAGAYEKAEAAEFRLAKIGSARLFLRLLASWKQWGTNMSEFRVGQLWDSLFAAQLLVLDWLPKASGRVAIRSLLRRQAIGLCRLWVMSRLCENRPVLPLSTPKQTLELGMSAIRSEADRMTPLSYV